MENLSLSGARGLTYIPKFFIHYFWSHTSYILCRVQSPKTRTRAQLFFHSYIYVNPTGGISFSFFILCVLRPLFNTEASYIFNCLRIYIYTLKEWNLQFRPLSTRSTVTFVQQVEYFKFRVSAIDDEVKTSFSVQLNPRLWVLDHARLLSG